MMTNDTAAMTLAALNEKHDREDSDHHEAQEVNESDVGRGELEADDSKDDYDVDKLAEIFEEDEDNEKEEFVDEEHEVAERLPEVALIDADIVVGNDNVAPFVDFEEEPQFAPAADPDDLLLRTATEAQLQEEIAEIEQSIANDKPPFLDKEELLDSTQSDMKLMDSILEIERKRQEEKLSELSQLKPIGEADNEDENNNISAKFEDEIAQLGKKLSEDHENKLKTLIYSI